MIRKPVPWPNGARVACAITFDMDADSLVHLEHPEDSFRRIAAISMLRYGPQVGVPRILEAYRRFGIKQTFFVPAWCIEQYPEAVAAMVEDGHEVGSSVEAFASRVRSISHPRPVREAVNRSARDSARSTGRCPGCLPESSGSYHSLCCA